MTLDEQYQKVIDDQRLNLLKLQQGFNEKCEEAKQKAQEKLADTAVEDKNSREEILNAQKQELEEALHYLKTEVAHSTRETMKKLEIVISEKEKNILADLEKQLASL